MLPLSRPIILVLGALARGSPSRPLRRQPAGCRRAFDAWEVTRHVRAPCVREERRAVLPARPPTVIASHLVDTHTAPVRTAARPRRELATCSAVIVLVRRSLWRQRPYVNSGAEADVVQIPRAL
jgi:hypothetical protein